jgi:hypothetical protein
MHAAADVAACSIAVPKNQTHANAITAAAPIPATAFPLRSVATLIFIPRLYRHAYHAWDFAEQFAAIDRARA